MSAAKKTVRAVFNAACLARDGGRCRICGNRPGDENPDGSTVHLTAHHITDRKLLPNGGYVASNGITLCDWCHMTVEDVRDLVPDPDLKASEITKCSPSALYKLIGSSYEQAVEDSRNL